MLRGVNNCLQHYRTHGHSIFLSQQEHADIYSKKYDTAPGIASAPPVNFFSKLYEEWLDNWYYRELSPDSIFYDAQLAVLGDRGHVI